MEIISPKFIDGTEGIRPWSDWNKYSTQDIYNFCQVNGIYAIPTEELIEKLCDLIPDEDILLEVACGRGYIGRELSAILTDSKLQDDPNIKKLYEANNILPIVYPNDVEKLEASEAVRKYLPNTVLVCYGTPKYVADNSKFIRWVDEYYRKYHKYPKGNQFGIDYLDLWDNCDHIISVSTLDIMRDTPLMKFKHNTYKPTGCYSHTGKKLSIFEWKR